MVIRRARERTPLEEPWEYKDEGCEFSPSCLCCPFPHCLQEEAGGKRHRQKKGRDEEVLKMRREQRKSVPELARKFRLSRRTIYRILKEDCHNGTNSSPAD